MEFRLQLRTILVLALFVGFSFSSAVGSSPESESYPYAAEEHSTNHSSISVIAYDSTSRPIDRDSIGKFRDTGSGSPRPSDSKLSDDGHHEHAHHEHAHHEHADHGMKEMHGGAHHQHMSEDHKMDMLMDHGVPDTMHEGPNTMVQDQAAPTVNEVARATMGHKEHSMAMDHKEHSMAMDHKEHAMTMDHKDHVTDHKDHVTDHKEHVTDHKEHDHLLMKNGMNMDMNHSGMHGMKMWFHADLDQVVLFEEWKITDIGSMIGSVVGIILLGMFYEGLKFFREHLFKQYVSSMQFSTVAVTGESGRVTQVHKVERNRMLSWAHALQTCLHVLQIIISYFLMLIFMTYNLWLCLAVVVGAGAGYFVFGWKKATVVDITEHCH